MVEYIVHLKNRFWRWAVHCNGAFALCLVVCTHAHVCATLMSDMSSSSYDLHHIPTTLPVGMFYNTFRDCLHEVMALETLEDMLAFAVEALFAADCIKWLSYHHGTHELRVRNAQIEPDYPVIYERPAERQPGQQQNTELTVHMKQPTFDSRMYSIQAAVMWQNPNRPGILWFLGECTEARYTGTINPSTAYRFAQFDASLLSRLAFLSQRMRDMRTVNGTLSIVPHLDNVTSSMSMISNIDLGTIGDTPYRKQMNVLWLAHATTMWLHRMTTALPHSECVYTRSVDQPSMTIGERPERTRQTATMSCADFYWQLLYPLAAQSMLTPYFFSQLSLMVGRVNAVNIQHLLQVCTLWVRSLFLYQETIAISKSRLMVMDHFILLLNAASYSPAALGAQSSDVLCATLVSAAASASHITAPGMTATTMSDRLLLFLKQCLDVPYIDRSDGIWVNDMNLDFILHLCTSDLLPPVHAAVTSLFLKSPNGRAFSEWMSSVAHDRDSKLYRRYFIMSNDPRDLRYKRAQDLRRLFFLAYHTQRQHESLREVYHWFLDQTLTQVIGSGVTDTHAPPNWCDTVLHDVCNVVIPSDTVDPRWLDFFYDMGVRRQQLVPFGPDEQRTRGGKTAADCPASPASQFLLLRHALQVCLTDYFVHGGRMIAPSERPMLQE